MCSCVDGMNRWIVYLYYKFTPIPMTMSMNTIQRVLHGGIVSHTRKTLCVLRSFVLLKTINLEKRYILQSNS